MTDIESFLQRLGLHQYYDAFLEEGFDTWETVLDIQESDLFVLVPSETGMKMVLTKSQGGPQCQVGSSPSKLQVLNASLT